MKFLNRTYAPADDPAASVVVPPVVPPVVPAAGDPWYKGADAEVIGHMQTRGWDQKPANEVAFEAIKAHRAAEKFIGVPADQIARIPKEASDEAGWKNLWTRLGAPADPAGYDFTTVKKADGTPMDDALAAHLRATATELHLPAASAAQLAASLVKYNEKQATDKAAETSASLATAQLALKTNWGANFEANMFVAKQTAAKLGATPEAVAALEGQLGYDKVMELFRTIGTKIGEDKFVNNLNPDVPGVMTREQAAARMTELKNDTEWAKKYLAGGSAENRQLQALIAIVNA